MEALFKLANNFQRLRQGQIFFKTMSTNPFLKELVVHLNTDKQLEFGELSDGTILRNYSETSQMIFGKPDRPIMLRDTGQFWMSFEVILDEHGFEIDGDSIKVGDKGIVDLEDEYGENIYGLTEKNMNYFINALIPYIQKNIQQQISRGM